MPISTSDLDFFWQQARNLKSYHDLTKYIDNLPDSKSKERLTNDVRKLLNGAEGTGMSTTNVLVADVPSFENTSVNVVQPERIEKPFLAHQSWVDMVDSNRRRINPSK
jgi:hypothetical protein